MAVVNRYTQRQPARYTPRTLQELMIAPAYMRERHSALEEGMAGIEAELAKVDPLDVHSEVARMEQSRLYDAITEQADILNKEGFNPSAKSRFLRLNKDYQQSTSPTGLLGKINAAKKSYAEQSAQLLENATKMGYGPEGVQDQLNQQYAAYKQKFLNSGQGLNDIEMFQASLPPAYQDLQKDILEVGRAMGSEARSIMQQNGYSFQADPQTGGVVMVSKDGNIIETTNNEAIENAKNYLNSKWLDKGGQGAQSAVWQNLTPEIIADQINSGLELQRDYRFDDRRTTRYQFIKGDKKANYVDDFLSQYVQGYDTTKLDTNSPLVSIQDLNRAQFDEQGNLVRGESSYETYQDKVKDLKGWYDERTGKFMYNAGTGNVGAPGIIAEVPKDPHHMMDDLRALKEQHPEFQRLSDKDFIERLNYYRDDMSETFVENLNPLGANYDFVEKTIFGQLKGSGEKGSGSMPDYEVTIDGTTFTADQLYKKLGYDNMAEFKEAGMPSINGFVPALGKIKASVVDSEGNAQNIYIEAPQKMLDATQLTRRIGDAMLKGQAFEKLGQDAEGNFLYMVNDFTSGNPMIYKSRDGGIQNAGQLLERRLGGWGPSEKVLRDERGNAVYSDFNSIYQGEKMELRMDPFYNMFIGKDE